MIARDREGLLSLVSGGVKAQQFFAALVESFEVLDAFEARFVEAYGEGAWTAFIDPSPDDQNGADFTVSFPDLDALKQENADWQANAENEGVLLLMPAVRMKFEESSEGWVIDGAGLFPGEEVLVGYTETQRMLNGFVEKYMKAIGHEGIGPEDIDYQMGKDILILMMGGEFKSDGKPVNPDRFKIDDL